MGVGQELVSKGESHEKKEMSILLWGGNRTIFYFCFVW